MLYVKKCPWMGFWVDVLVARSKRGLLGFYVVSMIALWRMFWLSEVIGEGSNGPIMDLGTDVMVVKSERGNNGSIVLEYVC